ncbi:MAG: hypothetical protein U9O87_02080 [Verrucomicrobiota bacterium]|nr:hypothetical protein [Verrucomicrobiota bacterium]
MKKTLTIISMALGLTIFMTSVVIESMHVSDSQTLARENSISEVSLPDLVQLNFEGLDKKEKNQLIHDYINITKDFIKNGEYSKAEQVASTILLEDSLNQPALELLAETYFNQQKFKQAEKLFSTCLKRSHNDRINFLYGVTLLRNNKVKETVEVLSEEIKKHPKNGYLHYCMASAYSGMDEKQKAIQFLQKAQTLMDSELNPLINDKNFNAIRNTAEFKKIASLTKKPQISAQQ